MPENQRKKIVTMLFGRKVRWDRIAKVAKALAWVAIIIAVLGGGTWYDLTHRTFWVPIAVSIIWPVAMIWFYRRSISDYFTEDR